MTVLGLDIGGANLKAATPDKRAVSVPFALWKQPDRLPAALAELVAKFPDVTELAVTMTGELCDCYETKRQGVNAILDAVLGASRSHPVRVWTTDGVFVDTEVARRNHLKVAAANWLALATLAGQYVPDGMAILLDVGSTTSDVVLLLDGVPIPQGKTDPDRLEHRELVYTGVRRTPLMALADDRHAAELFSTTLDVYLHLGFIPEAPADTDTADGRPATKPRAFDRLCRMLGGDRETISPERVDRFAEAVMSRQVDLLGTALDWVWDDRAKHPSRSYRWTEDEDVRIVIAGAGEFLAGRAAGRFRHSSEVLSLTDRLGPEVSACAPAYAVAVLAAEGTRPPPDDEPTTKGWWPWSRG